MKMPVRELMPYVCVGLLIWGFISSILQGSGEVFSGAESYIKQVRLPYLLYVFRLPGRSGPRRRGDAGEQNGENAGEKDAVEGPRAAD